MEITRYSRIYSEQDVMAKKLCFSAAMVTFYPVTVICSLNAPKADPISLSSFTESQLQEIEEYASNFNEKPFVINAGNDIYVIIPSMFPTTTSCLFLKINIEPRIFLRLLKEKEELFVLSSTLSLPLARMSKRVDACRKEFLELCADIQEIFSSLERFNLSFSDDDVISGYYEQVISLSSFLAVPIDSILINVEQDGVPIRSNFALFTAFCTTAMMLAKNEALDRKISIELNISGGSVTVNMSFKTENDIKITSETLLWDYITSNRKMFFEHYNLHGRFCLSFEPIFIDWSYLGLKQKRNTVAFLNNNYT